MNPEHWKKVEEIYHAAFELEGDERASFLTEACGDDDGLRVEIESLLAESPQEDSFLSRPALTTGMSLLLSGHGATLIGKEIGPYKILRRIGCGGMGEVYLAEDPRLGRLVALKLLPPYQTEQGGVRRFQQEARAISAISHPNVAHVYETGVEDGLRFMTMEYVEGVTLRDALHKGIDTTSALNIGLQVASALAAAHEAGVIHRDIKPENIMLRADGYVKVLDFGLAKLSEVQGNAGIRTPALSSQFDTTPGLIMGTTAYMSPEQVRGLVVDERTDIWSLGVVIYEMLAGLKPFEGNTPSDIRAAILLNEPPPAPLSNLNEKEQCSLSAILIKALSKDVRHRYRSSKALFRDLEQLKEDLEFNQHLLSQPSAENLPPSVVNTDASNSLPLLHTSRHHSLITASHNYWDGQSSARKRILVAAVVGLIAFGVGIISKYVSNGSSSAAGERVQPKLNSRQRQVEALVVLPFRVEGNVDDTGILDKFSLSLTEDLTRGLGSANVCQVKSIQSGFLMRHVQNLRFIKNTLNVDTVLRGFIVNNSSSLQVNLELVNAGDGSVLWQDSVSGTHKDLLKLRNQLLLLISQNLQTYVKSGKRFFSYSGVTAAKEEAFHSYLVGRYDPDMSDRQEAIRSLERAVKLDQNFGLAYVALARKRMALAMEYHLFSKAFRESPEVSMENAKSFIILALSISNDFTDNDPSAAHTLLATIKTDYEGDWAGAKHELRLAIESNPNNAEAHFTYGKLFLPAAGAFYESLKELEIAYKLESPESRSLTAMAWTRILMRDYEHALADCERALATSPRDELAHAHKSVALLKLGRFGDALEAAKKAIEVDGSFGIEGKVMLGVVKAAAGRNTEAREVIDELEGNMISGNREISDYDLAVIYAAMGEKDRAFERLEKGVKVKSIKLLLISSDPLLDPLRNDPRFEIIKDKLNLHQLRN